MMITIKLDREELERALAAGALEALAFAIRDTQATPEPPQATPEPPQATPEPPPEPQNTAPEPREAVTQGFTLEEVRAKLADLTKAGKRAEVKELLLEHGCTKLTDLDQEHYSSVMEKALKL